MQTNPQAATHTHTTREAYYDQDSVVRYWNNVTPVFFTTESGSNDNSRGLLHNSAGFGVLVPDQSPCKHASGTSGTAALSP